MAAICLFLLPAPVFAAEGPDRGDHKIVLVADVSNSMNTVDSEKHLPDALCLAVDLAPRGAQVALITVNGSITYQSDFIDVTTQDTRRLLKAAIADIAYGGNTNLADGVRQAVSLLEAADGADSKAIYLISDISEGGLYLGGQASRADYDNQVAVLQQAAADAGRQGIVINTVLLKQAPTADTTIQALENLSARTGGQLLRLEDPSGLPACIERLYFDCYSYDLIEITGFKALGTQRTVDIRMPAEHVDRARIYVSAGTPVADTWAGYAGVTLEGEANRSYAMIDLKRPAREGIRLTVAPGDLPPLVYLMPEFTVTSSAQSENELLPPEDGAESGRQQTAVRVDLLDTATGKSLIPSPLPDGAAYTVRFYAPDGTALSAEQDPEAPGRYWFYPVVYGEFQAIPVLTVDGIEIAGNPVGFAVPDILPPAEEPPDYTIAVAVGCLIILTGILIALRHRRRESESEGAVEMESDYRFHGKLYVCAVMVDGGNKEIAPYNFLLGQLDKEKRVTLKQVLESGGAVHDFPGAEDILFLVGPEESIVVRNNANLTIRALGKNYGPRTKLQLFYGQKIYIVFEKDESELEVYYRKLKEDVRPVNINVTTARVR